MSMRKSSSDLGKPKMWLMKADIDNGIAAFKSTSDVNEVRLSCDCTCPDCKMTFNSYIDEKAMTKVLQERLDENQAESTFMIGQVKLMEDKYNARIEELEKSVSEKLRKIEFITAQLETERRLRMEEIYKLEFQKEESATQAKELREVRQLLVNATNALPNLERENKILKERIERNNDTIAQMDAELHQYSYELTKLEDANTRLRLRLNDSDVQIDQYRLNSDSNNMGSSSKSGASNTQMLRPIKTLRTSNQPISRSSKSSTSIRPY